MKTISKEEYENVVGAQRVLCEFCESDDCEKCQVIRLVDDAEIAAGIYDDDIDDE